MSTEILWTMLCQNIKESLSIKFWSQEDLPSLPQEQSIWANWNIHLNQELTSKGSPSLLDRMLTKWIPPPINMIQLNFDGASKCNSGSLGFRGVFRDRQGTPLLLFLSSKGWDTNNLVELEGLWQGLTLAHDRGFFPLIIEGDS